MLHIHVMERIKDGRRNILIHPQAEPEDLPIDGVPEVLAVAGTESFVPSSMDEPTLYPGDAIVGVTDDEIVFAELIYEKVPKGVLVIDLATGRVTLQDDQEFSARFFQVDELHLYDGITEEIVDWDTEFDASQIERPKERRAR